MTWLCVFLGAVSSSPSPSPSSFCAAVQLFRLCFSSRLSNLISRRQHRHPVRASACDRSYHLYFLRFFAERHLGADHAENPIQNSARRFPGRNRPHSIDSEDGCSDARATLGISDSCYLSRDDELGNCANDDRNSAGLAETREGRASAYIDHLTDLMPLSLSLHASAGTSIFALVIRVSIPTSNGTCAFKLETDRMYTQFFFRVCNL